MIHFKSCIVVGAGISGILVARRLRDEDIDVTLLDKGRHLGGRMASRNIYDTIFDHGAQFMTTRERVYRGMVESWTSSGLVKPWYKGPLGNMRYVGVDGMRNVPVTLAKDVSSHTSMKVTKLHFAKDTWTVTALPWGEQKTRQFKAEFLVLTAPVPQSLSLLRESNIELDYDEEDELERIQYTKCITALARLDGPAGLPNPGAVDLNHEVLRWIGDNSVKGIAKFDGCITINSSTRFAERYWDASDEERLPVLLKAAKPFLRSEVIEASTHRWAFSEPTYLYKEKQPFRKPYFIDDTHRLAMCGDGFGGPRIEAAAMSGIQLAEKLASPI